MCWVWSSGQQLNAVVIDVKGDRGFIPYESQSRWPAGRRTGPVRVDDFDHLLAGLKAEGRLHDRAHRGVQGRRPGPLPAGVGPHRHGTGSPWMDNEGLAWIDPFQEEAWAYPIAVAREAALKGFDEIQFDYLRFPSEGRLGAGRYSGPSTQQSRVHAIAGFLRQARRPWPTADAAWPIDVFGYTAFNHDDTVVGQRIEELAPLGRRPLSDGLPVRLPRRHPGISATPSRIPTRSSSRRCGGFAGVGAGAGPGSALDPGLPRLCVRPPIVRAAGDSGPDERRHSTPARPGGCSGTRATATPWRRSRRVEPPPPPPQRPVESPCRWAPECAATRALRWLPRAVRPVAWWWRGGTRRGAPLARPRFSASWRARALAAGARRRRCPSGYRWRRDASGRRPTPGIPEGGVEAGRLLDARSKRRRSRSLGSACAHVHSFVARREVDRTVAPRSEDLTSRSQPASRIARVTSSFHAPARGRLGARLTSCWIGLPKVSMRGTT